RVSLEKLGATRRGAPGQAALPDAQRSRSFVRAVPANAICNQSAVVRWNLDRANAADGRSWALHPLVSLGRSTCWMGGGHGRWYCDGDLAEAHGCIPAAYRR